MTKCNKSGYNHALYNQNRVRGKSNQKNKKAMDHKIELILRTEKEGETKWLKNALMKVNAKLKAMGISDAMIQKAMDRKASLSS